MQYCKQCGNEISNEQKFCPNCGVKINGDSNYQQETNNSQSTSPTQKTPYVENHLAKAILVTLFCCLPLGIVSIVNAASVNSKLLAGDIEGARIASEKANSWANWSIGLGLLFGLIYLIIVIVATLTGSNY